MAKSKKEIIEEKEAKLEEAGVIIRDSRRLHVLLEEFEQGAYKGSLKDLVELFIATWGEELPKGGVDKRGVLANDTRTLLRGMYREARGVNLSYLYIEEHTRNCEACRGEPRWECKGLQFACRKQFDGLTDDKEIWRRLEGEPLVDAKARMEAIREKYNVAAKLAAIKKKGA